MKKYYCFNEYGSIHVVAMLPQEGLAMLLLEEPDASIQYPIRDLVNDVWVEDIEKLTTVKRQEINAACEDVMRVISSKYPRSEMDTWDQQLEQAKRVDNGDTSDCDMLQGIADGRGITLQEQATRVIAAAAGYTTLVSQQIGKRQKLESDMQTIIDDGGLSNAEKASQLKAIAWPE